jgi:two-component system, NarL family, sensor histidine kinase UhpB
MAQRARQRATHDARALPDATNRRLIRLRLDLHDGPMQDLVAAGFALGLLQREVEALPADTTSALRQLDAVKRQLGEVERALRSVVTNAGEGDESPLEELVRDEIARFGQWNGARVEMEVAGDVEPATDSQKIALQRVLREALANVARHAEATEVRVELLEDDDVIYLRVRDNGKGCDPASLPHHADGRARLGLAGMQERLELLDGTLSFSTRPGGPTTVTAAVRRWRPNERRPKVLKALATCDDR